MHMQLRLLQGMLLKPEPLFAAVEALRGPDTRVVMMTPQGRPFKQAVARELAGMAHLLILCGHYEGVDHRVIEALVDDEISIGDYILTNGALAAAVVCDAGIRLLPGALGDDRSPVDESFSDPNLLEAHPHLTRIEQFGCHIEVIAPCELAVLNDFDRTVGTGHAFGHNAHICGWSMLEGHGDSFF